MTTTEQLSAKQVLECIQPLFNKTPRDEPEIAKIVWGCAEMAPARATKWRRQWGVMLRDENGGTWVQIDDEPEIFFVPFLNSYIVGLAFSADTTRCGYWVVSTDDDTD